MRVVRVLPDVPAVHRSFDYVVPDGLADRVRVGTIVRVPLHGRRVRGWVVADGVEPPAGVELRPIAKVTGHGPPAEIIELARWAAWRWAGPVAGFLRTASPPVAVRDLPPGARHPPSPAAGGDTRPGSIRLVRIPPAGDVAARVVDAVAGEAGFGGPSLVIAPEHAQAKALAAALTTAGERVALMPRAWARAASGWTAVGTRVAAWAPVPRPAVVVVVDAHDEALQGERAPTWHARDVAIERARRSGADCVLLSPCPPLDLDPTLPVTTLARPEERAGWAAIDVVDLRKEDPATGLFSARLTALARSGQRVVCVLNRKGRATLLACAACAELARCESCGAAVRQQETALRCKRCGAERPVVCASCGATRLKAIRRGVSRVRDELEALAGASVVEMTGDRGDDPPPAARLVVGTEAALHRVPSADAVAFLDFDQELLAPRFAAGEHALALLARASRLVGGRRGRVVIQTRMPGHEVIDAALHADPSRLAGPELARRRALGFPPYAALALVSGDGAAGYVDALGDQPVEILGPDAGRWLVRAPDHVTLCDALAAVPRPRARLRIEVDPPRV